MDQDEITPPPKSATQHIMDRFLLRMQSDAQYRFNPGDPIHEIAQEAIDSAYALGAYQGRTASNAMKSYLRPVEGQPVKVTKGGLPREWRPGLKCFAVGCKEDAVGRAGLNQHHSYGIVPLCEAHHWELEDTYMIAIITVGGEVVLASEEFDFLWKDRSIPHGAE